MNAALDPGTEADYLAGRRRANGPDHAEIPPPEKERAKGQEKTKRAMFPLIWAREADPVLDVEYVVKGIIAAGELCVIYGPPKSGKTFLAVDLALSVGAGLPWFGHRVRPGLVIYLASEMGVRAMRRVRAWMDAKLGDATDRDIAFVCVPRVVNLLNVVQVDHLNMTIDSLIADHGKPALVIVDTLARSMIGGDENSAQDMGRAVSVGDQLRDRFNAATVIVHHSGKATANGARGSSALLGAADTMIRVEADADSGARTAEIEWCRDGEAGERLGFKLRPVPLGIDADGDTVSTCIIETMDAPAPVPKPQRVPKGAEVALKALREVITEVGERMPATSAIPPDAKAVSIASWRERFYCYDPLDIDTDASPDVRAKAADSRLKRFGRIRVALQDPGVIGIVGGYAWINGHA